MEHHSQRGGGGRGGLDSRQPSEGRSRLEFDGDFQRTAILSLNQIRVIRSCNNYTEGPTGPRRPAPPKAKPRPDKLERTHEVVGVNNNNDNDDEAYERRAPRHAPGVPVLSRSTSTGSAASSGSNSSVSSEQGLLGRPQPGRLSSPDHRPIQTQPKSQTEPPPEELLKPPASWKKEAQEKDCASGHRLVCEQCGRCKCVECTAPRTLPSCLACGGLCLCSAETLVEHSTCMCLVKALFYHCSNDDEGDSCADSPCSLSRSHCCSRFLCMGLMSTLFPCLLCYPPAKSCVKACQRCYDRANRPGCRCKNSNTVYCKLENWAPPLAQGKPF